MLRKLYLSAIALVALLSVLGSSNALAVSGYEQYLNRTDDLAVGSCDLTQTFVQKALRRMRLNPGNDANITTWLRIWDEAEHRGWSISKMIGDPSINLVWDVMDGRQAQPHYSVGWNGYAGEYGVTYPDISEGMSIGFKIDPNTCEIQSTASPYIGRSSGPTYTEDYFEPYYHSGFHLVHYAIKGVFDEPNDWQGVLIPDDRPTSLSQLKKYVAMGDSFSSGEGNPPFFSSTNNSFNACHRSVAAYPYTLMNDSSDLDLISFVACSGATTNDIVGTLESDDPHGKGDEPSQISTLSDETDIVTITVGGNDVHFDNLVMACFTAACGPGSFEFSDSMNLITNNLGGALDMVYRTLLGDAPNAQIYVSGYPYITPQYPTDPSCTFLQDSVPLINISDATGGRMIVDALNTKIGSTILTVQNDIGSDADRLHFVNPTANGNSFDAHDVCSSVPAFVHPAVYPDVLNDSHNWMHPNILGHQKYADVIEGAMN